MSNERIRISRRKALVGLGSIGLASAGAGLGTYAQFTDQEEQSVTFTAGGIDGQLSWGASYNKNQVADELTNVEVTDTAAGVAFNLTDVKPGDYGSITFELEVTNNPAWVSSCVGYANDIDGRTFEPEVEADDDLDGSETDPVQNHPHGELADNLLIIPFYSDGPNTFFDDNGTPGEPDGDWTPGDMGAYGNGTTAAFWNSREGTNDFGDLQPRTLHDVATGASSKNTILWNEDDGLVVVPGPEGASVESGCVVLDGDAEDDSNTYDDEREASPLEPDDTLNFGYDWHLPYTAGNALQGDSVTMKLGFTFSQVRHSDAPQFQNSYDPGNYTPNDDSS